MGLKYNAATGKLLRTATPKLVDECSAAASCANTQARVVASNIAADECSAAICSALNTTTYILLPETPGNFAPSVCFASDANCVSLGAHVNADYLCAYGLDFQTCGGGQLPETFQWRLAIWGKLGVGWAAVLAVKSPGRYNFEVGNVASFCWVFTKCKAGTGAILDYTDTFNVNDPATGVCGSCNTPFWGCNWIALAASVSIELQ